MSRAQNNILIVCIAAVSLGGCASLPDLAYERAVERDTARDYEVFLTRYKNSKHVQKAKARLDEIRFAAASKKGTASALESYLSAIEIEYPASPHKANVEQQLDDLRFKDATSKGTTSAYERYLKGNVSDIHRQEASRMLEVLLAEESEERFLKIRDSTYYLFSPTIFWHGSN